MQATTNVTTPRHQTDVGPAANLHPNAPDRDALRQPPSQKKPNDDAPPSEPRGRARRTPFHEAIAEVYTRRGSSVQSVIDLVAEDLMVLTSAIDDDPNTNVGEAVIRQLVELGELLCVVRDELYSDEEDDVPEASSDARPPVASTEAPSAPKPDASHAKTEAKEPERAALKTIDDACNAITEHLHLLECALDGRFDTKWEARSFKAPIGAIFEATDEIEQALKTFRMREVAQ